MKRFSQAVAVFLKELLDRGYVVFAVVHGSQPRFTILILILTEPSPLTETPPLVRYAISVEIRPPAELCSRAPEPTAV